MTQHQWGFFFGIIFGFLILFIAFWVRRKQNKNRTHYDERQKLIHAIVIKHSFILLIVLLFVNSAIVTIITPYTSPIRQSLILCGVVSFYYMLELNIRGAYFGMDMDRKKIRFYKLLWCFCLLAFIPDLYRFISGRLQWQIKGFLSDAGAHFLFWLWLFALYSIIVCFWELNAKREKKKINYKN